MSRKHELGRRIADYYETEAPPAAPEWVLREVLATIDITPQRRVFIRVPWRLPTMNTYAKLAAAAVAVVAIGVVGITVLRPGNAPGVGGQAVTPSPEPSISPTSRPTPSPTSARPLTETFTSRRHGVSLSYPGGWTAQAATEPWTGAEPIWSEPTADFLYDPVLRDHLFLKIASQPIGDFSPDEWLAEHMSGDCTDAEQTTVDGATGLIGPAGCNVVAVTTDGRGYIIVLHTSRDEAWISPTYDRTWFEEVLATVRLHPEDAAD